MKILSLTNTSLDPALGSGKTRLAWTSGFKDGGNQVDIMTPNDYYRPWPLGKARRIKMRLDALGLENKVSKGNYDIVEFYGAEFGLLTKCLSQPPRKDRPLLVAHTDGLELLASRMQDSTVKQSTRYSFASFATKLAQPVISRLDYLAFSYADCFVTGCEADQKFIVENNILPLERCAVVEPGIDEVFLTAPWQTQKKQWLLSFGSWTARKDPATIVRVASELLSQIPDLEFHMLGASASKQDILNAFSESLKSRIVVYPQLSQLDIVKVLSQAKVFLFPSLYEGFGMATTEAMACGCAVVVTPTGFGEAIHDGEDGFVCNFHDVEMFVTRCLTLLRDEELRLSLVRAGRKRVCGLTWPAQVRKLEAKYKDWMQLL